MNKQPSMSNSGGGGGSSGGGGNGNNSDNGNQPGNSGNGGNGNDSKHRSSLSAFFHRPSLATVPGLSSFRASGSSDSSTPKSPRSPKQARPDVCISAVLEFENVKARRKSLQMSSSGPLVGGSHHHPHHYLAHHSHHHVHHEQSTSASTTPVPEYLNSQPSTSGTRTVGQWSEGLGTINEQSMEDVASQKLVEVEIEPASQTDSSSSVPDYLTGKFPHSVTPTSGVSHEHDLPPPPPPSLGSKSPLVLADGLSLPFEAMVAKMSPSNHSRLESPTTTTTTSESYQLNELPPLPARLATLSKPTPQSLLASALRSRKARHSIDVRALPSYLARKRGSTFGQFLSTFSPTAPEESSSSDDPLFSEPVAPTLSLGERVAWVKSSGPEFGNVKWIGRMPPITNDWTVGIEFDNAIGSGDGTFEGRRYFVSKENFAKFLPLSDLTKVDNYAGRPRSGTMLSRMSVQLKPGQLISIQRSPTTVVPHCSLNAPHHVGHDVHSPNNRHCQCPSCNHPCAHICKTRKPKGKRWTEDMAHMCHFSSKPHAQMCCGGEDLPTASCIEPGASWKHNEVIASLRTVPTEAFQSSRRRSNVNHHLNHNNHVDASPPPPLFHSSDSSPHQASHHQQHQHHHHQHRSHSGGRENSYHYQAQQQQQQPPLPQKSAHFQQSSHGVTQNSKKSVKHPNSVVNARQPTSPYYGAGILERSGSDLSISSLPSSSSVAEVFINRSVLTDESDIDSETEQSLASSRKKVATTGKQGLRQIVATFLANSLRLKRFDKKEKKHDDDDDNFYFSHPNGYRNKNKRTKKSTRDGKSSRHRNKMHRSAGLSSTDDGSSYTELPAITNGFRANETLKRPATLFSTTARTPAQIPSACTKPGYNRYNQQQTTSMCNDASCRMHECNCSTARPCDLSEETSTSGRSSAPRSIHTQPERPSTNASCESVPSPRKRKIKGPAPKPPTTASNSMMSNVTNVGSPATAVSTSCPSSLPQSPTNSSVITNSHSNSSKTKLSSSSRSKGCAPPPPSIASNSKNDSSNDATVRASDKDEENLVLLVNASLSQPKVYSYEQSTETLKNDRKKQLVAEDESIYQLPLPVAVAAAFSAAASREHPPELPTKTFDPLKAFGCRLNNQTCKLESHDSRKSPLGDAERLTRSQSMPFTNPTCCLHHWKEYLNTLTMTSTVLKGESAKDVAAAVVNHLTELNRKRRESDEDDDEDEEEEEEDDECDDNSSCHAHHNHLIDALLSPKHTHKLSNGKQSTKSQNSSIHDDLSTLCHAFANCELLRALSDGSLTNTSAATVVEYIQDDAEPKTKNKNNALVQTSPNKQNQQQQQKLNCNIPSSVHSRPFLSDVFCQTTFDENPLESTLSTMLSHPLCALPSTATLTRKHKPHKSYSCRCRKSHKNRTNCRHRQCHREDFNNNNNPNSDNGIPGFVPFQPTGITGMSPAAWLTSSTSEHSEMSSSMSSSTSTLSDGSSLRASNNLTDYRRNCSGMFAGNCSNQQNSTVASLMNPFPFLESDQPANQFFMNAEQVFEPIHAQAPPSGRSSVSSDKLLKSKVDPYAYPLPAELDPELANNHRPEMFMGSLKLVNSNLPTTEEAQNKCLMTELEVAIANGNHHRAAILAKELAIKRANCQLARNDKTPIVAYLYVEDRNNHRGPIPFQVYPSMTVNMLKLKVEKEFGFGCDQQKWVLGRNIATNMGASLASYGINHSGCPIFLYVLTSPTARATPSNGTGSEVSAGEFVGKTNGNLSDESDTVYESLRSTASTVPLHYPLFENGTKSIDTDKASTRFGPPEVTDMNGGGGYEPNEHQQNQAQNLVKNYFYQEGEVPFANELVFEALAVANEMLPRVEEEDEEDLSQEEEVETIAERRTNNPLPQPEMMPNLIKVPVTGTTPTPIVVAATVTPLRANGGTYKQLMDLEDVKCVRNVEPFDCPVCLNHFKQGEGVVLRDCLHTFCRECLMATIEYCEEVQVKCPFRDAFYACEVPLQDREVRELSTEEIYERYLRRSVAVAEKNVEQSFHCKTVDCAGWCVYDDNVNIFRCPVCEHENCINCQAVHEGVNCLQFQEELEFNAANDQDAKATKQFLEEMLTKDEAMRCPQCKVVLMKKWGCDWVKCSMCDTEICWITKGFRWGPNGRGDTSGGCKCMVGGIRCSPECKYCH